MKALPQPAVAQSGVTAFERGLAAQQAGKVEEAIGWYRKALRLHPGLAAAHFNLGQLFREQGRYLDAVACFEGAARLRPTAADAWLNLGAMLERVERYREAVQAYQRAAACGNGDPTPTYNLGNALLALGDFRGAQAAFNEVIEQRPDHVSAQWNLASALLAAGDFRGGWLQYEYRWRKLGLDPSRRFPWPIWRGERAVERRILIWREQGLGDELLFATCLRELVAAGADVTLAATPRLVSLFTRAFPSVSVITDGDWADREFDYHAPIGDLPRYLRPNRHSFPLEAKYLVPDSKEATRWAGRLDGLGEGLKVGICWRSGLINEERARYYSPIEVWGPLFAVPGVHWINLQYDQCDPELELVEERFGVNVRRWPGEDLKDDLESVVGLIWNLDAVITAPTAVSSLAGALGTRCWEVDNGSDWTAHGEPRCPWFPSIRVVRRAPGTADWTGVIETIASELSLISTSESGR